MKTAKHFCDSIHEQLEALQSRMELLKANVGTSLHFLHDSLEAARQKKAATGQAVSEARVRLDHWIEERQKQSPDVIEHASGDGQIQWLAAEAREAERYAELAIQLDQASIDDAEWMILVAIASRIEEEAVSTS